MKVKISSTLSFSPNETIIFITLKLWYYLGDIYL